MNGLKAFKTAFICAAIVLAALCAAPASLMQPADGAEKGPFTSPVTDSDQDYVGSETCEHCHEAQ
jgi:hypothetical protein